MSKRILVQAGHIAPREPGHEGGTGTTREQEYTRACRDRLAALLKRDPNYDPIPCPGDIPDGIKVDAALFLHGDGSASPKASGYCFGFPADPVNASLARLLGVHLERIPGCPPHGRDNYTGGLSGYYGYRRVASYGPEVLHEVGFLTNPAEQKWVFANLDAIANALYRGICAYFKTTPVGTVKPAHLGFTVEWTDKAGVRHSRKTWTPKRLVDRLWADGIRRRILVRKNVPIQDAKA